MNFYYEENEKCVCVIIKTPTISYVLFLLAISAKSKARNTVLTRNCSFVHWVLESVQHLFNDAIFFLFKFHILQIQMLFHTCVYLFCFGKRNIQYQFCFPSINRWHFTWFSVYLGFSVFDMHLVCVFKLLCKFCHKVPVRFGVWIFVYSANKDDSDGMHACSSFLICSHSWTSNSSVFFSCSSSLYTNPVNF